jgi:predicted DNA-binding transcriptional regulator AlpA
MRLQLFSIDHAPRALPIWQTLLDDLSNPPPARVARVLGVGVRTVYRWNRAGSAPRSACLALFWLTRWGRSEVHAQAVNDALMAVSYLRSLQDELDRTRLELAHVLALNASGSANQPLLRWPHG